MTYADKARAVARKLYGSDEVEIDADAEVAAATDGGSWVAAWVYLSNETLDAWTAPTSTEEE
jgi:hypothetical protein